MVVTVQKTNRKGESSKRESAFVSREIQSILIEKQVCCFLVMSVSHRTAFVVTPPMLSVWS